MGWHAARKLRKSVDNLRRVLAVELVASARGIELRAPLTPSPATGAVITELRKTAEGPGPDRYLAPDLLAAEAAIASGAILAAAESVVGKLGRTEG